MAHAYDSVFQAVHTRASGPGGACPPDPRVRPELARRVPRPGRLGRDRPRSTVLQLTRQRHDQPQLQRLSLRGRGLRRGALRNAERPGARGPPGGGGLHPPRDPQLPTHRRRASASNFAFDLADVIAGAAGSAPARWRLGRRWFIVRRRWLGFFGTGTGAGKIVGGNPWGVAPSDESEAVLGVTDSSDRVAPTLRILGPACRRRAAGRVCRADAPGALRVSGRAGDAGGVARVELAVWRGDSETSILAARLSRIRRAWARTVASAPPAAGGSECVRRTAPATRGLRSPPGSSCPASVREVSAPSREEAWQLVTEWIQDEGLRSHLLGVEAAMGGYARKCGRGRGDVRA